MIVKNRQIAMVHKFQNYFIIFSGGVEQYWAHYYGGSQGIVIEKILQEYSQAKFHSKSLIFIKFVFQFLSFIFYTIKDFRCGQFGQ